MDPFVIIEKYYDPKSKLYHILIQHSIKVRDFALEIAKNNLELNPDLEFIKEASMLHDIGIFQTNAQEIFCSGTHKYIEHGTLGKNLLEKEGFPKHGLVCERHTGVGLTKKDIIARQLPLPKKDMIPQTIEEEIICLADKFYGKLPKENHQKKSIETIEKDLRKHGENNVIKFRELCKKYKLTIT
ncbi:MAG: HDIG domain-containing protein [Candidatus ainarchaeum sp.]|nr:HDIG domain-containing protein [Candidatus ainarchaeum sp.]